MRFCFQIDQIKLNNYVWSIEINKQIVYNYFVIDYRYMERNKTNGYIHQLIKKQLLE